MKIRNFVVAVLLIAMIAAVFMIPVGAVSKTENYGMVVFLKGSEFFNWCYAGALDAAKMLGPNVKVTLYGPAEWDASLEARAIDQLVAAKAAGIMATAGDAHAMNPSINRAIAAKIPVVLFDSDAPDSKRLAFCGTNNYNAGYAAGKAMAEWLKGEGNVGISMFVGPDHLAQRVNGFKDGLAKFGPKIKVVQTVNDEGDVAKAETVITGMLQAHPEINGIFCAHGNPGTGAAAAVRNLHLQGKVQIMAFDFGMPIIELIENGEIRGTVGQDPYLMGFTAMMQLYAAKHSGAKSNKNSTFGQFAPSIDTGVAILGKDVIGKYKNVPKFK
jgi:ribose transport system substrate-binding protein